MLRSFMNVLFEVIGIGFVVRFILYFVVLRYFFWFKTQNIRPICKFIEWRISHKSRYLTETQFFSFAEMREKFEATTQIDPL